MKTKKVSLNFFSDAGHGWLRVNKKLVDELSRELGYCVVLGVSSYSYYKNGWLYLEEDCDANIILEVTQKLGIRLNMKIMRSEYSKIRSFPRFTMQLFATKGA